MTRANTTTQSEAAPAPLLGAGQVQLVPLPRDIGELFLESVHAMNL